MVDNIHNLRDNANAPRTAFLPKAAVTTVPSLAQPAQTPIHSEVQQQHQFMNARLAKLKVWAMTPAHRSPEPGPKVGTADAVEKNQ